MFPFAKKSLGQNFLNSPKALADIIAASEVVPGDMVLEIGPGRGALTKELLKAGAVITAIEKDRELVEILSQEFAAEISLGKLHIIEGDILEIDLSGKVGADYKLIANIPYYITGQIFRMFLEGAGEGLSISQPKLMTLLVQKEVAERVIAKDNKESILSLSVKAYGEPKYISTVKAGSFSPAPKVDSAIILIKNITKEFFTKNNISEAKFFEVLKVGFAHKRKMLAGNLKGKGFILPESINKKSRAEDLTLNDFLEIVKIN